MRVTYYALRDGIKVGDSVRNAGDLIPEASAWPYLSGYVADGKIAPVLVVTLPQEVQDMLTAWEKGDEPDDAKQVPEGDGEGNPVSEDEPQGTAKPGPDAKPQKTPEGKARR